MGTVFRPIKSAIVKLVAETSSELTIVSPWLKHDALACIGSALDDPAISVRVLARGEPLDFVDGASDLEAFERLVNTGADVGLIGNLHAKVFISDGVRALVGSANLTPSGLKRNVEAAVELNDPQVVTGLRNAVLDWRKGARSAGPDWLAEMARALATHKHALDGLRQARSKASKPLEKLRPPELPPKEDSPDWRTEIRGWLARRSKAHLGDDVVRFFELALTHLPGGAAEMAYWGTHRDCISLTVGNVWAAVVRTGKAGRTRLLSYPEAPSAGHPYVPIASTLSYSPVGWLFAGEWETTKLLNETQELWAAYEEACRRLMKAPMAHLIIHKNTVKKHRVVDMEV